MQNAVCTSAIAVGHPVPLYFIPQLRSTFIVGSLCRDGCNIELSVGKLINTHPIVHPAFVNKLEAVCARGNFSKVGFIEACNQ